MLKLLAIATLIAMSLGVLACSDENGGNGDTASERDEFIQDAENRIGDLRTELDELRGEIASGDADEEVEQQADSLETRINEAESELDSVRNASDDEWEELSGSVDEAIGDAGDLAEEIGSELGID